MALDKLTQITSSGINSTTPLTGINVTGIITASSLSVSGITTGAAATFDSVDVLGVLTYDDVTNIDALGIVTARSGIHVTGGDVGIGTGSPNAPLEVQTASGERILFDSAGSNQQPRIQLVRDSGVDYTIQNSVGTFQVLKDSDNIYRYSSNIHQFYTAGSGERMRIGSDGNVGIGTDNPGSLVHALGSYGTVRVENDNTAQYAASGIELKGPAGDERSTKIIHGNSNAGGTETYFQIEQYNAAGSYVKTLSTYSYQYDYWAFNTGASGTERLRITSDGTLSIPGNSSVKDIEYGDGTTAGYFRNNTNVNRSGANQTIHTQQFRWNNTKVAVFKALTGDDTTNKDNGYFVFETANSGTTLERLRITSEGKVLIGTTAENSFNGVGLKNNLIVAGSTSDTDITDNSSAAITISNKDGTANNTSGLHFAREDTDGNPHYAGASIVTQFKEAQVTGQYPKADLAFLTSTAANNAPSEKMRIYASGAVTTPSNPLLKLNSTDTYGAYQSLHISPNVSIAHAAAQINVGDTSFTTSGSNAYTFVCPVTGVYALHAHISLGNITQGNRVIWSMAYTLGGGNLPLSNYVEVIDTNVSDYENASYFDTWYFTAGTRVGMGINSNTGGSLPGFGFSWGMYLLQ